MADLATFNEAELRELLEIKARDFNYAVERGMNAAAVRAHAKATDIMGELLRRLEATSKP